MRTTIRPSDHRRPTRRLAATATAILLLMLVGCGSTDADESASPVTPAALTLAQDRVDDIGAAVARWEDATTLPEAKAAAEEARSLISGADTFGAGDLDDDGSTEGTADVGLLPSDTGEPGLATSLADCPPIERDILGGPWTDAGDRWATLETAIDEWTSSNNTFPSLPSHPQRIIGWATLTQQTTDVATAHEYSGHARLHVTVTQDALTACR